MSLNKYMGLIGLATLAIVCYKVFFSGSNVGKNTATFLGLK